MNKIIVLVSYKLALEALESHTQVFTVWLYCANTVVISPSLSPSLSLSTLVPLPSLSPSLSFSFSLLFLLPSLSLPSPPLSPSPSPSLPLPDPSSSLPPGLEATSWLAYSENSSRSKTSASATTSARQPPSKTIRQPFSFSTASRATRSRGCESHSICQRAGES